MNICSYILCMTLAYCSIILVFPFNLDQMNRIKHMKKLNKSTAK
ncbi:hypothetical protein KIS4809_3114 [Bacillus sp. ZZV12-4809]|nr:hypothetical protein KIS4809_3114 [Bacillus sp. ZZV12-4809]